MPGDDFGAVFAALDALKPRIVQGAVSGLAEGAAQLQAAAQATTAYEDQTGAERASTAAYVAGASVDASGAVGEAISAAGERNGEHALSTSTSAGGQDDVVVVLTAFTDYAEHLETGHAGAHASIGPTMDAQAGNLHAAAARGIGEVFR